MKLRLSLFALIILPSLATADNPPTVLDFNTIAREQGFSSDCAITFDDGPGAHTGQLLDVLKAKGVHATFFVLGQHVKQYPDTIRRMVAEGHEVENHSWDHPDMKKLDEPTRQKEMEDTVAQLKNLGVTPHYFRPPYGSYDPSLAAQAHKDGLELVLWSHDSIDWRYHTVAQLEGDILPKGDGAHGIFLFHDIHDSTIAAMPAVLDQLQSKGCVFTTVSQWVADTEAKQAALPQIAHSVPVHGAAAPPAPVAKSAKTGWFKRLWQ